MNNESRNTKWLYVSKVTAGSSHPPPSPDYPFTSNLFFASFSYSIVLGNERRVVDISTNVKSYRVSCLRDYTYILYVSIVSLQVLRFFLFSLSFSLFFFCFFNASNFVVVVIARLSLSLLTAN